MIGFYTDADLTHRITSLVPKKFLAPGEGAVKMSRLYFGDPDAPVATGGTVTIAIACTDTRGLNPQVRVAIAF